MKVLHLINKKDPKRPGLKNLEHSKDETNIKFSGFWDISEEDAYSLVGGILYLHEAKSKNAAYGGRIVGYEIVQRPEFSHANRVVFKLEVSADLLTRIRGQAWRGADHAMASYGGILTVEDIT